MSSEHRSRPPPQRAPEPSGQAGGQRGWWFEDAVPGTTVRHRGGRTVTADEHQRLAWLTDNASDVHGDAHRSASSVFGEPVVLGALSAAIVAGLAAPACGPATTATRVALGGWRRIALRSVVLAGDTLRAASTFHGVQPDGAGGMIERTIEGRNQRGDVVVVIEEATWVPARPAGTKDC
jgi:acyl dehydratase